MKKIILTSLLLISTPVFADTPVGPMNYQGRLLDNGIPVGYPAPTAVNFVVRVYDAASGGALKYQETHNGVTVDDGVYNFLVGTKTKDAGDSTWSVELWNCCANLFMEITANGETLLPRSRLAAAPYAFQANLALTTNNALALGGKSSGAILQDICVASKGKWLELANQCLGIGSSFPGPTMVNLSTLTASTDLSNLDLSKANISGIDFGTANLTNTQFIGTTYHAEGLNTANLTNSYWDGAIDTALSTASFTGDLRQATFKNMSMSRWGLSSIGNFQRYNL